MVDGLKIISLFSGAGGMDIGFEQAGFNTSVFVEADPACCNTLRKNRPNIPVIEGDICNVKTSEILQKAKMKVGEAALVIGGPPCQSFSLAGKRMGLDDPRGKLLWEFARIVKEVLPVAFLLENVRGMANWQNGKALDYILNLLTEPVKYKNAYYEYNIEHSILNAADFGVAQNRERIFLVGNRINKSYNFPTSTHGQDYNQGEVFDFLQKQPTKTVWDAIGSLPEADEPSEAAKSVSRSIKERIKNHGY